MYRIKYWHQDTVDSGYWCTTGIVSKSVAEEIVASGIYVDAEVFPDEEYAICSNCAHSFGEECELHGGREVYPEDTCVNWTDKDG